VGEQEGTVGALTEAAGTGDRMATLRALRDVLAASIEEAEPDKRASLAARLAEVLDKIAAESPAQKGSVLDEFTARRQGRDGAGSADSDAPRSTRERTAARRRR